ncbi:CRN-like protein [Plasmopara halstedii]|uniref:CRN-like protein n=1 Tax=Plasmopara halstedii TaxID=4781 RepID=A0A0P1A6Z5_PLAHL|nr:CRN-like protein [Plasmopara halstedii]CEG36016.1 CRN-like protein [Plasmopara halstedii]|eukprot:XP_024572385.1 CRN-like protein [Plasmopara halstedii]
MVTLSCAVVGAAGSAFPVDIDEIKLVGHLKDMIKVKKPNDFKNIDPDKLQLFLAKTADGVWLSSKDPAVVALQSGDVPDQLKTLLIMEMYPADEIGEVFERAPTKKTIHVLVVVPKDENDRSAAMALGKNQEEYEKTSTRDTNKKRRNRDIDSSLPYSSLSWTDLEPILSIEDFNLEASAVPQKVVEELRDRLMQVCKLYGDVYSGKEGKQDVEGKNVHVHGRFEFVLKRGKKHVSIVEAKRDDFRKKSCVVGLHAKHDPVVDPLPSRPSCSTAKLHGAHEFPSGDGLMMQQKNHNVTMPDKKMQYFPLF